MRALKSLERPGGPRILISTCVLVLACLLSVPSALPKSAGAGGGEAVGLLEVVFADAGDTQDGDDNLAARQLLNQRIYRKRIQQVVWDRAVRELDAGRTVEGLFYLQTLLDQPEDGFVWVAGQTDPVSAQQEAARILSSLDPAALRTYERHYGPAARQLFKEAQQSDEPFRHREVTHRFYHTAAGFQAADWQASRWLDRGQYRLAVRCWSRLISEPVHRNRVTTTLLLKAALAHRLSGEEIKAVDIIKRIGDKPIRTVLRTIPANSSEWISQKSLPTAGPDFRERWLLTMGRTRRNLPVDATTPYLKPIWKARFTENSNYQIDRLVSDWEKQQRKASRPLAVANFGIVAGTRAIFRDFEAIRALNLSSGQATWTYRCETSLARATAEIIQAIGSTATAPSRVNLQRAYVANATLGMLASDGQRVYAIDSMDFTTFWSIKNRRWHSSRAGVYSGGNVSRESNRLIALEIEPSSSHSSGQNRPVWSIGGAVGVPKWFFRIDQNNDGRVTPDEFSGKKEPFKSIDANGDGVIKPSEAEAASESTGRNRVLAGHFFLGPPLPVDGRLYAVTEANRQLNLVALKPETGELLWSQGIGFVDRPIEADPNRYPLSCSPSYSEGVLVCPTQLGILVGVDAQTGLLLWAYYDGDGLAAQRLGRWTKARSHGHTGFPSLLQIEGGRIVVLPRHSTRVHCINLFSGQPVWKIDRGDGEYVGTVTAEIVLIVGRQYCRGVSLQTGREQWSTRLGMPSGCGLRSGSNYLLPLQEGRVATIDLSTGREIGFTLVSGQSRLQPGGDVAESADNAGDDVTLWPGNLIAGGEDTIISVGARQAIAFPQAAVLLDQVSDELQTQPRSEENLVLAGELELLLGNFRAAKPHLLDVLALPMSPDRRRRAEILLRELLYRQLKNSRGNEPTILTQLDRLAKSPAQRGRYLIQRAEFQLRDGDFDGVLDSTREFAALELREPLPIAGNEAHLVSAASWIPSIIGRIQTRIGDAELTRVSFQVDREQQAVLAAGQLDKLRQFLAVYARWPQAAAVRTLLARKLIERGRFQEAELLLLENRKIVDPRTAAVATQILANLWDRLGIFEEAAGLLAELEERFGGVLLEDGRTTRQYVAEFPREGLTWIAYQRLQPPKSRISRVRISEQGWFRNDLRIAKWYGPYRQRIHTPQHSPFQLFDKGSNNARQIAVIDKQSGMLVGHVEVFPGSRYSNRSTTAHVGHFFPLGSRSALSGISLLEYQTAKPLWTIAPKQHGLQREPMRVGPAGPSFCTFQSRRRLLVVEPANGRTLWQRTDLDSNDGTRIGSSEFSFFGDDEVLVLLSSNDSKYIVYRTATGEELRRGQLDIDSRLQRRAFGRKLFYVSSSPAGRRLRIWDPLSDHLVFDRPVSGHIFSAATSDNELVLAIPPDGVLILDVVSGETRLDFKLDPSDFARLNHVRAFRDHGRYYVNFERSVRVPHLRKYSYHASDTLLPVMHMQGDLYAVDRETGKLLWKRTIPPRSIIRTPHLRLPFLVGMSRVGNRTNGRRSLLVEVIDSSTGDTIGFKENIFPDRLVQLSYDPADGRIELLGLKTLIDLDFSRTPPRILLQDETL